MSGMSSYYLRLVTSEHANKPKFNAMLSSLLSYSDDVYNLAVYLDSYFDIDNAIGKQEDILGDIVGIDRTLNFQPDRGISPVLEDEPYRKLLQSKIVKNMWNGGIDELLQTWNEAFGSALIVQDNQDMTLDICAIGLSSQIIGNMIQKGYIIPKPMGVGINFHFSDSAVFAYGVENDNMKGYGEGLWERPTLKDSFGYGVEDDTEHIHGYGEGYWT
ncbi:DUF2612 domain-containing protein [Megasphaera sueciensis]|uniref:DUF2612 domain-containing protein n=1 Tax=Megasphaera sueciensis TaxID=349094 RepID=UPI003D0495DA